VSPARLRSCRTRFTHTSVPRSSDRFKTSVRGPLIAIRCDQFSEKRLRL
jgi:hypothetical protein